MFADRKVSEEEFWHFHELSEAERDEKMEESHDEMGHLRGLLTDLFIYGAPLYVIVLVAIIGIIVVVLRKKLLQQQRSNARENVENNPSDSDGSAVSGEVPPNVQDNDGNSNAPNNVSANSNSNAQHAAQTNARPATQTNAQRNTNAGGATTGIQPAPAEAGTSGVMSHSVRFHEAISFDNSVYDTLPQQPLLPTPSRRSGVNKTPLKQPMSPSPSQSSGVNQTPLKQHISPAPVPPPRSSKKNDQVVEAVVTPAASASGRVEIPQLNTSTPGGNNTPLGFDESVLSNINETASPSKNEAYITINSSFNAANNTKDSEIEFGASSAHHDNSQDDTIPEVSDSISASNANAVNLTPSNANASGNESAEAAKALAAKIAKQNEEISMELGLMF